MLEIFVGTLTFNMHIQQAGKDIEHLISNQLVEKTPALVAQFLRNTPNLDKVDHRHDVYAFIRMCPIHKLPYRFKFSGYDWGLLGPA